MRNLLKFPVTWWGRALFALSFTPGVFFLYQSCVVEPVYPYHYGQEWPIRAVTECENNVPYKDAEVLSQYIQGGMSFIRMDTNHDEIADVVSIAHSPGVVPIFWLVDRDFDGTGDEVYIDPFGRGGCDDIRLYCVVREDCPRRGPGGSWAW